MHGHSGGAVQSNFSTEEKLQNLSSEELYHIGDTSFADAIKEGALVLEGKAYKHVKQDHDAIYVVDMKRAEEGKL